MTLIIIQHSDNGYTDSLSYTGHMRTNDSSDLIPHTRKT